VPTLSVISGSFRGVAIGTRRLAPLVALAAASLALGACGGDDDDAVDTSGFEEGIASGLAEETGEEPTSVECPDETEVEEGTEFECTATASDGTEAVVEVTLTDDEGNFNLYVPPEQFE